MKSIQFFILLLATLCFTGAIKGQRSYNYYTKSEKQKIFREDFDINNSQSFFIRPQNRANVNTEINDGNLIVHSLKGNKFTYLFFNDSLINSTRNYEIEISFMFDGISAAGGLVILDSLAELMPNELDLLLNATPNNAYIHQGEKTEFTQELSPLLSIHGYNDITFRKIDDSCFFFLNQQFFYSRLSPDFKVAIPAIFTRYGTNIKVDYIKASYIDGPFSYSFYNTSNRTDVLNDNFTNNNNNWPVVFIDDLTSYFGDDYFEIKNESNSLKFLELHNLNRSCKYFELEISAKSFSDTGRHGLALVWSLDTAISTNCNSFGYDSRKKFYAEAITNTRYDSIELQNCDIINPFAYNKLTVRKVNELYYCFINETLVLKTKKFNSAFQSIGLYVSRKSTVRINKIRVSYLDGLVSHSEDGFVYSPKTPKEVKTAKAPLPLNGGKFYALIIGAQHYNNGLNELDYPLENAANLHKVLKENYEFDSIIFLKDPSKEQIGQALLYFRNKLTTKDNFLVYYAGHGCWDAMAKQGYWIPPGSLASDYFTMLSNSDIKESLARIPALHTFLISDACFSGSIVKYRDVVPATSYEARVYQSKSSKAMTSGAMTTVPDHSLFSQYLISTLRDNTEQYLTSQTLFVTLSKLVGNDPRQGKATPQFGVILDAEDQGGDFVFIKKAP